MNLTPPSGLAVLALALQLLSTATARADETSDRIIGAQDPAALKVPEAPGPEVWKDSSRPVEARVQDLLGRMSLAEKTSQLLADAAAVPRLGLPAYSYRNEAIHGVVSTGFATVFPQAIGMAATWNAPLIGQEADVISTEARAKFNDYARSHGGASAMHHGISFYAPNINIVRDPRWGRGQETYGEDPFLTAQCAVAFIRGLQGDDPRYVKTLAAAKHFAVHSGPEPLRRDFNATPPEQDLYDTYLPAFEAAVRQAHVGSVMASYNALYGVPNCANPFLLNQVLRERWGFAGFVVSDGNALVNLWRHHHYRPTPEEAVAAAIQGGCDLVSAAAVGGNQQKNYPRSDYEALGRMLEKHLVSEAEIDRAVGDTLAARFRLGLFDPPDLVPWSSLTLAQNDTPEHRQLALKVAEESIVLLQNDGVLPLDRSKIRRIAVIGPNADAATMLSGNYEGKASRVVTILNGIKQVAGPEIAISYSRGCPLALKNDASNRPTPEMRREALAAAQSSDVIIYVGGLDATLERENHPEVNFEGFLSGDRTRIELPAVQEELLKALQATGKPVVFVDCSGSAMATVWEAEHLPALVQAWYPGEEGGLAVADVLFGEANPAGRLPITFYRSTEDLPPFTDYAMSNRTYRYFTGSPLFAFGHGLSYTRFDYSAASLASAETGPEGTIRLSFTVTDSGPRDGDEVAQVYFQRAAPQPGRPRLALCGFARIHLAQGHTGTVAVDIPANRFRAWDSSRHAYAVEPGGYDLLIGGSSDDIRLRVPVRVLPPIH